MKLVDPTKSRDDALRYFKREVKSLPDTAEISLDTFRAAIEKNTDASISAFQQVIFGEHQTRQSLYQIEQSLLRFRGLFIEVTSTPMEAYNLSEIAKRYPCDGTEYNISDATSHFLKQLITDFYLYLTRNSSKRQSVLRSLKILRRKYSEELKWLHNLEKRCVQIFGGKQELTKNEFHQVIEYQKELSDKIFDKFNTAGTGSLNVKELYDGLVSILTSNTAGRLKYLFDIYDRDGNGTLNKEEVEDVLRMCVTESDLDFHEELVQQLCDIVWGNVTGWTRDQINFDEFYATLLKYPAVYDNLDVNFLSNRNFGQVFRFLDKRQKPGLHTKLKRGCIRLQASVNTNISFWIALSVYLIISLGLLAERLNALIPRPFDESWFVAAKCAGQLLNFNIAFTLILTLKHVATILRKTFLRRFMPFDDMLFLHKMIAYIMLILVFTHMGSHGLQIYVKLHWNETDSPTYFMDGQMAVVFWTGIELIPITLVFIAISQPAVRAYSYELFLRTHQVCAIIWYISMLFHAHNFWKWVLVPAILLAAERLYFLVMFVKNRTTVETGLVHGNITQLTIRSPKHFKFSPGDYVNINIPEISRTEWHPFTISCSPDHLYGHFTLHIRKVGNWTGKLYRKVQSLNLEKPPCYENSTAGEDGFSTLDSRCMPLSPHDGSYDLPPTYSESQEPSGEPHYKINNSQAEERTGTSTKQEDSDAETLDLSQFLEENFKTIAEERNNNGALCTERDRDSNCVVDPSDVRAASLENEVFESEEQGYTEDKQCYLEKERGGEGIDDTTLHYVTKMDSPKQNDISEAELPLGSETNSTDSLRPKRRTLFEPQRPTRFHSSRSNFSTLEKECKPKSFIGNSDNSGMNSDLDLDSDLGNVNAEDSKTSEKNTMQKRHSQRISVEQLYDERRITPVEKRILHSRESSCASLDEEPVDILTKRRESYASRGRRESNFSLQSSRTSICIIPVEEAARLNWKVYLDGPYSTPSHDILKTKHAILVAGGIGITPFSSVLESVIKLLKDSKKHKYTCSCGRNNVSFHDKAMAVQRIDFFWVTRDQAHLSWFHQVFKEIEEQQTAMGLDPPLVHLHIYLTGLKKSEDIRGAFLQLALEMIYQQDSLCVLSGLKAKTMPGRPDWKMIFKNLTNKPDKENGCYCTEKLKNTRPKVYACGPPALCDELRRECSKQDIPFKEEIF